MSSKKMSLSFKYAVKSMSVSAAAKQINRQCCCSLKKKKKKNVVVVVFSAGNVVLLLFLFPTPWASNVFLSYEQGIKRAHMAVVKKKI
jgi:hypothetical protein